MSPIPPLKYSQRKPGLRAASLPARIVWSCSLPPNRIFLKWLLVICASRRSLYTVRLNFDPIDARGSAGEAWAAEHKIGEADFVDPGQVWFLHKSVLVHSGILDLEYSPADVADQNFLDVPVFCRTGVTVADEKTSVCQLQDEAKLSEAGLFRAPDDLRHRVRQIKVIRLVFQSDCAWTRRAGAEPDIARIIARAEVAIVYDVFGAQSVPAMLQILVLQVGIQIFIFVIGRHAGSCIHPVFPESNGRTMVFRIIFDRLGGRSRLPGRPGLL